MVSQSWLGDNFRWNFGVFFITFLKVMILRPKAHLAIVLDTLIRFDRVLNEIEGEECAHISNIQYIEIRFLRSFGAKAGNPLHRYWVLTFFFHSDSTRVNAYMFTTYCVLTYVYWVSIVHKFNSSSRWLFNTCLCWKNLDFRMQKMKKCASNPFNLWHTASESTHRWRH